MQRKAHASTVPNASYAPNRIDDLMIDALTPSRLVLDYQPHNLTKSAILNDSKAKRYEVLLFCIRLDRITLGRERQVRMLKQHATRHGGCGETPR